MSQRIHSVLAAGSLAVVLTGCTMRESRPGAAPPPNVVTITAAEFSFNAPDTVPAGLTTIHLVTTGQQPHQVAMLRLADGKTLPDLLAAMRNPGPPPEWVSVAGGVNPPRPGGTAEVTMPLEPGTYALLCFIPGEDGVPHLIKGMSRQLVVVSSTAPPAAEPVATDTMTMSDYAFATGAPIVAGKRTFRLIGPAAKVQPGASTSTPAE